MNIESLLKDMDAVVWEHEGYSPVGKYAYVDHFYHQGKPHLILDYHRQGTSYDVIPDFKYVLEIEVNDEFIDELEKSKTLKPTDPAQAHINFASFIYLHGIVIEKNQ